MPLSDLNFLEKKEPYGLYDFYYCNAAIQRLVPGHQTFGTYARHVSHWVPKVINIEREKVRGTGRSGGKKGEISQVLSNLSWQEVLEVSLSPLLTKRS